MLGQPPNQSFQLEHAERDHDLAGGHTGAGDRSIDGSRLIVQMARERSFKVGKCQLGRMTDGWFLRSRANFLNQRAKFFENFVNGLDQAGTVTDQAMAAPAGHAIGRPGYGKDFAILFHGVRRRRERPAARGCFHDQHTKRQPGNDPVALGESATSTSGAGNGYGWQSNR